VLHAAPRSAKPLGVFLAPRADDALVQLQRHGVASFRTPESCADAVNAYLNWKAPGERPSAPHGIARAGEIASRYRNERLSEHEAGHVFAALGIPVAAHRVLSAEELHSQTLAPHNIRLEGPFAVKVLSPDIPHKTDAGMVVLDVLPEDLIGEARRLLREATARFPAARIDGVLVQVMERGIAEVIVGYSHDAEVGPVVMLGMGGVAAELRNSITLRIAPVTLDTARDMIREIPELQLLQGFRNLPQGDCDALAAAVRAMSLLAQLESRRVSEAEINPLIVKEEGRGVVAVDGLLVFGEGVRKSESMS
jgi:acyl-CoA synthetase (NDP forming)